MAYQEQNQDLRQAFEAAGTLLASGRVAEAEAGFRKILETDPACGPAWHALGRIAILGGHIEEAVAALKQAVNLTPEQPNILNDYAIALIQCGQTDLAVDTLRLAVEKMPDNAEAHRNLGLLLVKQRCHSEALPVLKKCAKLIPQDIDTHLLLANTYCQLEVYPEALDELALVMAARPKSPAPYETMGIIYSRQNQPQKALQAFDEALQRNPDMPVVIGHRGIALVSLGRFDEARAALKTAIGRCQEAASFLRALADLGPFIPGDDRLPALEEQKARLSTLPPESQVALHLALGKAYDDLERRGEAMHHWNEANRIFRRSLVYDEAKALQQLKDIAQVFTKDLLSDPELTATPSELPVFIVGMPRSGTSLLEQIIASHPDAFGAGELADWNGMIEGGLAGPDFPAHAAGVSNDRWHQLGSRYLDRLKNLAPEAKRVTDKMPPNFRWLGAIHLALPRAKFLYIHRNPGDCALSCLSKCFPHGFEYIYDQAELGRYMRACEQLMAHWKAVLPEESLMEVEYEALVQDFEAVTRKVLAFLGLAWDDACLRFYQTDREVLTASSYAVRQPLNSGAVGRSRAYAPWLKSFFDAYAGNG